MGETMGWNQVANLDIAWDMAKTLSLMELTMKSLWVWALTGLVPAIFGCGSDIHDGESDEVSVPDFVPMEGVWTFGSGSWVSDECQANFLSTPTGWQLLNATTEGFDISFEFVPQPLDDSSSCTLGVSEYECGTVAQKSQYGSDSIVLEVTAEGIFSTDIVGVVEVTYDIECSGKDCGGIMSANPCTSVQSFDVFFDG